jgi:hypothetical protein
VRRQDENCFAEAEMRNFEKWFVPEPKTRKLRGAESKRAKKNLSGNSKDSLNQDNDPMSREKANQLRGH